MSELKNKVAERIKSERLRLSAEKGQIAQNNLLFLEKLEEAFKLADNVKISDNGEFYEIWRNGENTGRILIKNS